MKLSEAYKNLGAKEGDPLDDVKRKYKDLAKKYHPDLNKAADAESKFKVINEAYECVKSGKSSDKEAPQQHRGSPFDGFAGFGGNPFEQQRVVQVEQVETNISISFKESVLGCHKDLTYSRKCKCDSCQGNGIIALNNGCKKCKGQGKTVIQQGNSIFMTQCPDCRGKQSTQDCSNCKGEGSLSSKMSVNVLVPPGVLDGQTLRLQGMGSYAGSAFGAFDQYTDAFCHIKVKQEPGLSIEGQDVITKVVIPLIDALKGCKRTVNTINGNKEISIPAKSRNAEQVIIPNLGVAGTGNQRVVIDVYYPMEIDGLINHLDPIPQLKDN